MTFQEIQKITDLEKKESELIKYYLEEIEIMDWLYDDTKHRKILYSDRIEYRTDNKLHNVKGPAVEKNGEKYYYINGEKLSQKDWETITKTLKRHKTLKKLTN
jgi:hypothetical protein